MNSSDGKGGVFARVTIIALLIFLGAGGASALSMISPQNDEVLTEGVVFVQYTTPSTACEMVFDGITIPLRGCVNVTISAPTGKHTVIIWDGFERASVNFTAVQRNPTPISTPQTNEPTTPVAIAAPLPERIGTLPTWAGARTITPDGVTIRGRTPYTITSAIVTTQQGVPEVVMGMQGRSGVHRVELQPIGGRIRSVVLEGVSLPQQLDIGLEELPLTIASEERTAIDAYAIDPSRVSFSNGTLTKTAAGNRLWKCAAWDFDTQTCLGEWVAVADIVPGMPYDVFFTATDPAYVETFDADLALDVDIVALDNTTVVIAFIDGGSNNASFEVWNTRGIRLVDQTVVDGSGDTSSRISVDAINSTHFVIGVLDGPLDDVNFYIYDYNGNVMNTSIQVDANTGAIGDVAVCDLGDRFAIPWADANDGDANFEIWSHSGGQIANENQVDIGITPGANGQNLVSCSALNTTHWGYAFYDDVDNDASLAIVQAGGTIQVTSVDIDINVGEVGQVATAGLRQNRIAMAFYDSTDQDVTITIRSFAAAAMSTILAVTDIDTAAGSASRVAMTEIENDGVSEFVVAWQDTSDTTIKAAVFNATGSTMTAAFNITTTPNTTQALLDVAGYSSTLGTGLCNGTFAIAYSNGTAGAVFETYWRNGTRWDGRCGAVDTTPPVVTLISPENDAVNDTSNTIDFLFNITDESAILNCSLLIDGVITESVQNPARDTTINITTQLSNGEYIWNITCTDLESNINETSERNITVDVPLLISGSDVDIVAIDNTTLVIAFIDAGSNQASFEIWNTNGTRMVNEVDVDTTVDSDSRIAAETINSTHFALSIIDGPEDDTDVYIYRRDGTQIVGQTQVDASGGNNNDVALCELGDRFAVPWADANDGDANYRMWGENGVAITAETQVDTSITPGATQQNLVACSALNTSHWGYAFYDDVDNDASLAIVQAGGTIQVTSVDIDINVGELGQVATAGLRQDRIVMAFYDNVDQDITITIRSFAAAAMSTILAVTDIDTAAGANSRVAATEIENNGVSEFVVAWQDTNDTTIKAAVFNATGSTITAPFNITTVPSATSLLIDLAGVSSTNGIGICNGTFAIAYTNSSGNTLFEMYWRNGSRWDGECGQRPVINEVTLPTSVVLNAGTTKTVLCNFSATDLEGATYIIDANATLLLDGVDLSSPESPSDHYINTTCARIDTGTQANFSCSFDIWYFAHNGTWSCAAMVRDVYNHVDMNLTVTTTIDPLYAVNISETLLDFGDLQNNMISDNISENLTNVGNLPINITVRGYGESFDDGYSFHCQNGNLSIDVLRFASNITANYTVKEPLNSSYTPLRMALPRQTVINEISTNTSYWQVFIPVNTSMTGQCNGTIVFQAIAG